MPRSKWISFGAQQSLERRAKADASADANASLPSAEEKKFGLENVCFHIYIFHYVTVLTFGFPMHSLAILGEGHRQGRK